MYRDIFQMLSYSSNLSKVNRIWHLICFKNLELFMAMRHICFWQHQSTSRGWWVLKRLLMECLNHLGKKLFLAGLLDGMLYELEMQDQQKNDCWTFLKMKQSFRIPASWKIPPSILQNTEENDWQTANRFQIPFFMENSTGYYGPTSWIWIYGCPNIK